MIIAGRKRDLGGGFFVSRILPYAKKRALGPFVFFFKIGPQNQTEKQPNYLRPKPHKRLSNLT
jgi:redox-sensitive bicupin YhaK (pirin superfamily)